LRASVVSLTLGLVIVSSFGTGSAPAAQTTSPQTSGSSSPRQVLDRYCVTCHNTKRLTAGLALDQLDVNDLGGHAATWEKVAAKLRSGSMPPAGLPRPDRASYDVLAFWLEAGLDRAAAAHPNPGRSALHRLNRAEYTNAVRDVLALEIDGRALLPEDDSGYGFDNVADVLSVSPALLERYMSAAAKISRLAVGDPATRPVIQTYRARPTLLQTDRMSEQLPFGSRGGMAVAHYFPLDGEYLVKIRLQRTHSNQIRGLGEPNRIEVRLDRARIKEFTVGGDGPRDPWSAVPSASLYEQTADDGLEIRLAVKAGTHLIGVSFPQKSGVPEGALEPRLSVGTYEYAGDRDSAMSVDSLQVSGPYNPKRPDETPSRARIFICSPTAASDEEVCARKILSALARRAFRRPVVPDDIEGLLVYYRAGRGKGSFDEGIELAIRSVLVDPDFLFRVERDPVQGPAGAAHAVSDIELASRLAFFLWSSVPDDELIDLAVRRRLREPGVQERQVSRMLRDPRSTALISNFAGQWLHLRNLRTVTPDPDTFPDFDDNLREALQRETEFFVESQLREDRSVIDLLTADYTFVNERLARHYGLAGIHGTQFRKVTFNDSRRGGLLGQASILTVTSYPNRTSPTLRGKWMLENLLGAPPPPPPPNVPALEDTAAGRPASVRERMELHRKNPVCASCHAQMDPLGLALENFDGIGMWRRSEANGPIDATAALADGTRFEGLGGVRDLLVSRRERFASTVAEKLMTYALGRGLEYYDQPAIREVLRGAAPNEYRWSSLITGIVKSVPFQMRTKNGG